MEFGQHPVNQDATDFLYEMTEFGQPLDKSSFIPHFLEVFKARLEGAWSNLI